VTKFCGGGGGGGGGGREEERTGYRNKNKNPTQRCGETFEKIVCRHMYILIYIYTLYIYVYAYVNLTICKYKHLYIPQASKPTVKMVFALVSTQGGPKFLGVQVVLVKVWAQTCGVQHEQSIETSNVALQS